MPLTVRQLLDRKSSGIYSIRPDASVLEALELMAREDISSVLVSEGDELKGIFTERDYARKVILKGRSSADTPVREIMSASVLTVAPGDSVNHCMQLVTDKRVRHLPVVDAGRVIGVVSIGDLVKAVIEQQRQELDQLQQYIVSG